MSEPKTKPTEQRPADFLKSIEPEAKRNDSRALLDLFEEATGEKGTMWGTGIIGFGSYQVKSGAKTNDWPLVAFSPRKQNFTLYLLENTDQSDDPLFEKLGKHTRSKACLYINKLTDVDLVALKALVKKSFLYNRKSLT